MTRRHGPGSGCVRCALRRNARGIKVEFARAVAAIERLGEAAK